MPCILITSEAKNQHQQTDFIGQAPDLGGLPEKAVRLQLYNREFANLFVVIWYTVNLILAGKSGILEMLSSLGDILSS